MHGAGDRPLLIFVSDIHLTDSLHGTAISKKDTFARFWERIQGARGKRPATLCFVGDLFDIVRSPRWFLSRARPYHEPGAEVLAVVETIIDAVLERESEFFRVIREQVQTGALAIHYVLGNHDRLLGFSAAARRKVWKAMTGEDKDIEFGAEAVFPDHGVIAYHGHVSDKINYDASGRGTIGDAIGSELIVQFPNRAREVLDMADYPELDDIDDVRPIYAVPAWVRRQGAIDRSLLRPIGDTWAMLVEEFFSRPFVRDWMKDKRSFGLDSGKRLRLLLELSTKPIMAKAHDQRLTRLYKLLQHSFDGNMARHGAEKLARDRRLRFVVNGHSHFASMVPLGNIGGSPAAYFNTGTWRTVHQIGYDVGGRPSFLPYDAMSYLVFFPGDDPLGRDYEWWTGALVARQQAASS